MLTGVPFEVKVHFSFVVDPVEVPAIVRLVFESAVIMTVPLWAKTLWGVPPSVYVMINWLLEESGVDCPAGKRVKVVLPVADA